MSSRIEDILQATIDSSSYDEPAQSRIEELLLELKEVIDSGGGGGTTNYNSLSNKPKINNIELFGNKTTFDLGITEYDDTQIRSDLENKVDKISGKGLSTEDFTTAEKSKLADLENYDDTQIYEAINSLGSSIGSMGQAVEGKVDKITGKSLSTNDYTTEEKTKLAGLSNYDDTALTSRVSALEATVGDINSVLEEVL